MAKADSGLCLVVCVLFVLEPLYDYLFKGHITIDDYVAMLFGVGLAYLLGRLHGEHSGQRTE